ncbi:MAG: PEGA domain-containing protein [Bacteroidales bacterium]|jgi:hypothetical protein|nr:PEGA domain-containing protein [Bacteroidales bacterium]
MKKIICLVAIVIFSSCATIVSDSSYPLSINSEPNGATVTIKDRYNIEIFKGITPTQLNLDASCGFFQKARYIITIEKEGYQTTTIPIGATLDGWYFGNIFFGGVIGFLIIDPASGAMYKLETKSINQTLFPIYHGENKGIKIYDINQIPQSWKDNLVEINNQL